MANQLFIDTLQLIDNITAEGGFTNRLKKIEKIVTLTREFNFREPEEVGGEENKRQIIGHGLSAIQRLNDELRHKLEAI